MTYYERLMQQKAGGAPTLSPAASLYAKDKDEEEKKKNRGGILGGLGYVGEKLGLGLLQGIEGVWDYAAGGIADLFGADAWAERQFSSDWLNYNHADDWYNPGEGWKVAGDVTGGIGTSLPGILTAAGITLATGGSGASAGVGLAVGSLSAAGTSTKEAMQESGELTGKEYLYGAGMGAVEAVTEKLSGGLGAGVTKAAKSVGKAFGKVAAKETAEAAAKSAAKKGVALSLKTAAKSAGKEFASEAFEEGFSEWVAPYIARATYDPNAQRATGEEILYSAFIGGLSGVGTAGGVGAFVQHKNVKSGTVIADEGRAKQILDLAKQYMEDGFSNTEDAQGIREIYEKLAPAVERGEALNIEQRRMLGELNSFEVAEQLLPTLQRSALTAVNGADAIAERLNADGRYKMVDDKFTYVDSEKSIPEGATVREITAEDITKGYDPSKKDSIREAIQKNDVLRYIAASDAAGRFIMTAKDFEKAALSGQKIQSQADLNLFIENASAEQKAAVGKELGVTDWNTLNIEGFNERAAAYRESGKAEAYKQKTAKIEKMKQLADSKPKSIPRAIALADGDVKHYADADSNIAIARTGDTFLVYDYNTGNVTRDMTRAEVNAELARYRQSKSATTETTNATSEKTSENFSSDAEIEIKDEKIPKTAFENEFSEEKSRPTVKEIKAANEAKEQAKRFDALAKEKIKDYDGLSEANKSMIRKIFREAEANGISEADALSYARVSARTGLDITFDKKACYKGKNEAGADVYHAGFYDPENNRIVVNPETKKKHTVLLIHELSHAMRSYRKNGEVKYFIDADAKVSEKMWKEIRKYYADENGKVDEGLTLDEASAYYAEAIFGTEGAIDLLLGEKPTLKQKILSFFAKSAEYYSTDEKLSKEARRHFRKFKAMFDAFTARNYGRNAETGLAGDTKARRFAAETPIITVGMSNSERATILKSKRMKPAEIQQAEYAGFDWEALERNRKSAVEKPLIKKLREFGHLRTYKTDSIDVEFEFTAGGLRKSMNSQVSDYGGTLADLAKVIMNMQKILDSSVLLEIHEDKAKGTPKENQRLLQTYVLLSAFAEGKYITPVQFEIKQYIDNENRLYLAVALSKIEKTGVMDDTALPNGERTRLLPVSEYSISDFIKKINPSDKNFFKYIPDELLTDEQKKAKQNAIAKENAKYHRFSMDSDYMAAVNRGDMVTAQRMVDEAAKKNGFDKLFYHGAKKGGGFTVFKDWSYFTENKQYAERYTDREKKGSLYTTYVRLENPFDTRKKADRAIFNDIRQEYGLSEIQDTGLPDWTDGYDISDYIDENELDYDGIVLDEGGDMVDGKPVSRGLSYVVRKSAQIKSADPVTYDDNGNVIPLSERFNPKKSDIRYSMEEIDPAKMGEPTLPRTAGTMSVGQYKKRIADLTKAKSYSKDQIYDIVKKFPMADMAMEKTREQVAEAVWQIYNEQLTASERREAAHDIAQFLTARLMSEAKTENPDATEANEAMAYLRTGIGRLAFSEADRAEILHNLDKDGWRRILGRWGFKGKRNADGTMQGVRTPMEVFVTDIAREMPGMEHLEKMHPVEAFLEIDSYYLRVKEEAAKKKTSAFLYMSDEDINSLAKSIEDSIVDAYNQGGGKSIFIKRIEQGISYYEQRAAKYKEEFNEIRGRDKIHGLLMDQTQKLKDLKLRRFANITDGANETFKNIISELARLQYRGNLSVTNAKKAVKDLYVWYTSKEVKENLFGFTSEDPGLWQQGVAEMLEELAADENKNFSKVELYALLDVLTYFTHFVQNFGKVWHHGEWVDAKELATNFIQVAQNQSKVKHHLVRDLLRKYLNTFGDPAAVVRMMDQYQDGFFTQIYDDLRDAAISASYAERDILSAYDDFLKKNKRYVENASKETVSYRGVEVPKMHLIGLYMTMKRKHAQAGYAINGFSFKDANGDTVRVRGSLDPDAVYTKQEIEDYIARERKKIENLLSDTDKQYISILEKVYNEDAKRLKSDRDIQRFGMTNATNDYYYPIRRANAAQKLDADMQMEIDRVSSASFNKDTVAGAKQELFIESADSLFLRHVHVVCQYAYLTPVLDMQKMLYNLDISGNKNHPVSIHTETQNIWPEGFKYFREMVSDVQGIPRSSSIGTKFLSSLRSNYAKFQLGANPKTWLTQFSSLFASTSLLDASSVIKGFGMPSIGFEQYSKLAKIRVEDNAAAKAQGVLDNKVKRTTDTIGDTLMAPIGMMDKFVVGRLFCACQVQIEKNGGAKIGMEENRIEAGKLLTRVILETQQNSLATERSAAMRSGNEFYRALTMFRSDSMKVIGRVIDGFGEVSALKGILKNKEMDADSRKELEARLKRAKKKTAKASASLILSAVFMAMVAQGFRWLYAKDKDEDETFVGTLTRDTLANMLGGLPGFADAYSKIVEGYDVGNYSYSAINDVLDSAKGLFDIAEGIMTGEGTSQERMRGIRNASYSLGQLLGIPTRNVYNLLYGLTKRISPRAGYKIDSAFYEKNFKTDLEKALEKGDDRMATLAMQLLLGERIGEDVNEAVFNELFELSKQGYKVLPRVTPDSISINGNVYEFTEDERSEVGRIYEEREQGLKKLFASSAYKSLSGEEKEKTVSTVYDLYYDKALSEALGVDRGNKLLFASAMGFDKYAVFKLKTSAIEPDTDRRGEKIEGSKRKNTIAAINKMNATREEKLLMIVASGYALKDGDIRGISAANAKRMLLKYILSMKGTQAEKAALAEACGFEVKNGKILKNSL